MKSNQTPSPQRVSDTRTESAPTGIGRSVSAAALRSLWQVALTALGVILGLLAAPLAPWFDAATQAWHYSPPTCENPGDLQKLNLAEMIDEGRATVTASSFSNPDVWPAEALFDGQPGSGWVPATISPRGSDPTPAPMEVPINSDQSQPDQLTDQAWVSIGFEDPQDIELLCVVNGSAGGRVSYERADSVRTARVSLTDDADLTSSHLAPLRSLPEHEIQNRQSLGEGSTWFDEGPFTAVTLEIVDRYFGTTVFDPQGSDSDPDAVAMDDEPGAWVLPTRLVMIGELEIYEAQN